MLALSYLSSLITQVVGSASIYNFLNSAEIKTIEARTHSISILLYCKRWELTPSSLSDLILLIIFNILSKEEYLWLKNTTEMETGRSKYSTHG